MLLTTRFCLFLRQQKHVQRFLNILRFRRGRRVDDQDLLRLAVIIAHDLPLGFADLEEAGDVRHAHLGLQFCAGKCSALRGGNARAHADPHEIFAFGQLQRRGANIREPVVQTVSDRERARIVGLLEDLRTAEERKRDPFLQHRAIDLMGELQRGDDLLDRGIAWVLVEFRFLDRGAECRRLHLDAVAVESHVRWDKGLRQGDAIFLSGGPVVLRRELQSSIRYPRPSAFCARFEAHASAHRFADFFQLRGRGVEGDGERSRMEVLLRSRDGNRIDGDGDAVWFRLPLIPAPRPGATVEREEDNENDGGGDEPVRSDASERSVHPRRATPGEISEQKGEVAFEHGQFGFCPEYVRARRDLSAVCKNLAECAGFG